MHKSNDVGGAEPKLLTRNKTFHPPKKQRGSVCSDMLLPRETRPDHNSM